MNHAALNFPLNLIKGKIAENIFDLMIRETKKFTVLHSGYENTLPEVAQYINGMTAKDALKTLRETPDFILISNDQERIYVIEVKYYQLLNHNRLYQDAVEMLENWNPSYLFVLSDNQFYFDSAGKVKDNFGKINPLPTDLVPAPLQEKYKHLAHYFLNGHHTIAKAKPREKH